MGLFFSLNTIFNLSIEYGPVLYYVLGIDNLNYVEIF